MAHHVNEFKIAFALRLISGGKSLGTVAKSLGISKWKLSVWAAAFNGLSPSEIREVKILRAENRRLLYQINQICRRDVPLLLTGIAVSANILTMHR